ncbi:hypothetical protein [Arthrobacter mobilis]|uniref:Uncharacterized protein n=1 Tax=Arthrobacter mobilis TaxID=2724944 RepID=A0A7X6K762_9MICC|nr:hypothetical protein [Arthrobacter mobilis]NKX56408.1 hypothetical protein [Arthrobacter mobilis]
MEPRSEEIKRKVSKLAVSARDRRTRPELLPLLDGMPLNSYYNFESGKVWPQSKNLRRIEKAFGWKHNILTDLVDSGIDPESLTLEYLERGYAATEEPAQKAFELTLKDLMAELNDRVDQLTKENQDLRSENRQLKADQEKIRKLLHHK